MKYIFLMLLIDGSIFCKEPETVKSQRDIPIMKDMAYHQGELVDTIICYFTKTPICITEPKQELKEGEKVTVTFFVPLALLSRNSMKRIVEQIKEGSQEKYSFSYKSILKPLKGLRLTLEYDPQYIGWEYGQLQDQQKKGLIFKLYNKKKLRTLGERTNSLRWYAQAKHQPRIVVDAASTRQGMGRQICAATMAAHISNFLKENGCDVLLSKHSPLNKGLKCSAISDQADLLLSFSHTPAKHHKLFTLSPALVDVKQSTLTILEQRNLAYITKLVHVQSALLETALDEKLKDTKTQKLPLLEATTHNLSSEILLGAEMPALCMHLGTLDSHKDDKYHRELARAIGSGILQYMNEKKFLKTLYKNPGHDTFKVTEEPKTNAT